MRLALLLLAALPSCSLFLNDPTALPPVPDEVLDRAFTPAELAADVDDLFALLEEVHPDLYATLPREEVARRRAALVAGFDRPLTRREFQPRLAELVAALGDGHTAVYLPQEEWWRGPAQACFPVDVAWDGAALRARHVAAVPELERLRPGARIESLADQPADALFRRCIARQSGESEAFRVNGAEQAFPLHLWTEGLQPPYRLHCEDADGASFDVEAPGLPWTAVERGGAAAPQRWTFERRAGGVALLSIDTFSGDPGAFETFLGKVFHGLHEKPVRALVVDLRRNGGGDSELGDELLQYIAHAPWRQSARKEWKMSDSYRSWIKGYLAAWIRWLPLQYLHPMGWNMWTTPAGESVVIDEELVQPRDEPLRFDGPVAFLIGPGTFSSAMSLAAAVSDYRLALLVGEPTGGEANGFGEVMNFRLPRTQLAAQVSSARFVRPNGDASTHGGVQPDLLVRPAADATGDPVLEAAVARLLSPVTGP